jgi:hypothetical protein
MKAEKLIFKGKFYLKSGCIVEEKVIFDEDNEQEDINETVEEMRSSIKEGFRNNTNFQFTFGMTIFRVSDISAVKFNLE